MAGQNHGLRDFPTRRRRGITKQAAFGRFFCAFAIVFIYYLLDVYSILHFWNISTQELNMATIRITGGSEAQNDRASTIAEYWLAKLNLRIADAAESGGETRYQSNLARAKVDMLAGFSQATAQQVINVHSAGVDSAAVAIDEAWANR